MRRAGPRFAFRRDPGGACPAGADYRDHGADPSKPARATWCVYLIGKEQQRRCARRLASRLPRVKHQDPAAKVRLLEIAASQTVVVVGASTCERVCSLPSSKSRMSPFSCPFPTREFAGLVSASLATGPRRFPNCQRSICGAKRAAHVDSLATSWQRSGFSNCRS